MNDFRAASRQSWSSVAHDWGELAMDVDEQLAAASEWIERALGLQPGERVLDLAAGPGTMSLMAARAVGPQGQVICTDFAEPMVDVARRRLESEGATNVEFQTMDAEAIGLPDSSVDAVMCRMGFMLMADPQTAMAEARRVLVPGGRLAFAVWSDAASNPWASLPLKEAAAHLGAPAPPPDAPGGLWSLSDVDRVRGMLERAGLDSIQVEVRDGALEGSFEDWFDATRRLAGPLNALLASLDEDAQAKIKQRTADAAQPFAGPDGRLSLPQRIVVGSGRRA